MSWGRALSGLFCVLAAGALPVRAQSADEFVQRALANNRDFLAAAQRVREAEALLRRAGVRPAPAIDVEGGSSALLGSPGSQDYSVAYSHPIETGGKRSRRVEVARLAVEVAQAEADERKRQLSFEVRQRYSEARSAARRVATLADAARINAETLRLITARVDEGDAAPLEKRLLETDLGRFEVDRVLASAKLDTALMELRRLGAIDDGSPQPQFDAEAAPVPASRDDLVQRALASRADLRALKAAEQQARSGVALAQSESSPNLNATARYSYRSTAFDQLGYDAAGALAQIRDRENVLSFGVSVPLFSGRKNQANIEASVAREREARLRREFLAGAIPAEIDAALRRWTAARAALEVFDTKVLPGSEANLSTIRQAWQLGHLRFLDVLAEQRRLMDLRLARVDAEAELAAAWAALENTVGGDIR